MTIQAILILVCGIVAIVFGVINKEFRGSTFWYLTAFWVALIAPVAVTLIR